MYSNMEPVKFYMDTYMPTSFQIPAFHIRDVLDSVSPTNKLAHPAFITKFGIGGEGNWDWGFLQSITLSRFQNGVADNVATCVHGGAPYNANFTDALTYSQNRGSSWHLTTAAEWAAVALWCRKNNCAPIGNNDNGKNTRESEYVAIPSGVNNSGVITKVNTGTGPNTWSHNRRKDGIWDLSGNVWEWCAGVRIVDNELQVTEFNAAANKNHFPVSEYALYNWKALNPDASNWDLSDLFIPVSPVTHRSVAESNTIKLFYSTEPRGHFYWGTGTEETFDERKQAPFEYTTASGIGDVAKTYLMALALLPEDGATGYNSTFRAWGTGERYLCRGGYYNLGASGIFSLSFEYTASGAEAGDQTVSSAVGFRSAYVDPAILVAP